MSIIEENGKAIGKAVRDIGGAFCGSIVSIAKDLTVLGKDTINAAAPKEDSEKSCGTCGQGMSQDGTVHWSTGDCPLSCEDFSEWIPIPIPEGK